MIRRIFSAILISIFISCSNAFIVNAQPNTTTAPKTTSVAASKQTSIAVNIDGTIMPSQYVQPYISSNSIVMIPLNAIIYKLENNPTMKIENGNVTIKDSSNTINFKNGDNKVTINDKVITLSSASTIKDNIAFVPIQFISEILNKTVDWNNDTNTVKINTVYKNTEDYFNNSQLSGRYNDISGKLNTYLNTLQNTDNFHGSVLVAQGGNILLDKGYGMTNFEQNIKNTPQTTFPIASMTKQFTAMAIMQLVQKGVITENDTLSKFIPDFPRGNEITIKDLLTHTSGIINYTNLPEFWNMKIDDLKNENNIINLFKNKPLQFKPGSVFSYSNSGYFLLGYIVEKVSGMSYENYLKKNIFEPLDMKNTGIGYNGTDKLYTSTGYTGYLDIYPVSDEVSINGLYGAGALYSTTEDLYKWDRALYTEKLVNNKTMKKIFSKYVQISKYGPYYGYGWMLSDSKYGKEIFHGGNVLGFTSNIERYPDKDLTIIILTNSGYYDVTSLTNVLADICSGNSYELPSAKRVVKVDNDTLKKYAGNYKLDDNQGEISIEAKDTHIYWEQNNGQVKYEIFPESQNKFFMRIVNAELKFDINNKNQVTGFELSQSGENVHADKIK